MASNKTEVQQSKTSPEASGPHTETRLAWIDLIRAGGAFLVVLAHVVLYPSLRGSGPLWAQSLYYTASRIAVPLFFMASGFLLLGKKESYGDFFRKRGLRVFIPFVVWSLIYLAWNADFGLCAVHAGDDRGCVPAHPAGAVGRPPLVLLCPYQSVPVHACAAHLHAKRAPC